MRLKEEEQFHFKNYLLKMLRSHAKIRLKSGSQNVNFITAKAMSKRYKPDCSSKFPCTLTHIYAQ